MKNVRVLSVFPLPNITDIPKVFGEDGVRALYQGFNQMLQTPDEATVLCMVDADDPSKVVGVAGVQLQYDPACCSEDEPVFFRAQVTCEYLMPAYRREAIAKQFIASMMDFAATRINDTFKQQNIDSDMPVTIHCNVSESLFLNQFFESDLRKLEENVNKGRSIRNNPLWSLEWDIRQDKQERE